MNRILGILSGAEFLLMIGAGYLVGFRLHTTPLALMGAVALLLLF